MGVVPGLVSVGANSGILRREYLSLVSDVVFGFSRREFRNLEAGHDCFSLLENLRFQSARIQES